MSALRNAAATLLLAGAGLAGGTEPAPAAAPADPDLPQGAVETDVGVSATQIVFGQSAALRGTAAQLGISMKLGIEAAFAEANRRGGILGRELALVSLDDGYEPELAIANTRALIENERVFALIGAVGTPTSRAAAPVAAAAGLPYVAPFTGADFLREADGRGSNVVNLRASYGDETERMVAHLTDTLGITRIAIVYQDDSFGRAGRRGAVRALRARDLALVSEGVYRRNTSAIKTALLDVRALQPEAVILVGVYEPVASLIAWARHIDFDAVFTTVSFVSSDALVRTLGAESAAGVLVTQVVPLPEDDAIPAAGEFVRALAATAPYFRPGLVSFEGYLGGRLAIEVLGRCAARAKLTRACFMATVREPTPIDLGGFELRFDQADNQGSDRVFLTMLDDEGRLRNVGAPAQRDSP